MAQVITEGSCFATVLSPDKLRETKITVVKVMQNDQSGMAFNVNHYPGYFESFKIRQNLESGKSQNYTSQLSKLLISPLRLDSAKVDSLESFEKSVLVQYNFNLPTGHEERIYFNPITNKSFEENPFIDASRTYPIELPYLFNQVYEMNMEVPKGYELEEMPKPEKIYLNENDGSFEYDVVKEGNKIKIECKLLTYRTFFDPAEYKALRDFIAVVLKKESEMIVFKKINK